jgi:hypothetical protein
MSRDSSVGVVTKLLAGLPWHHKCILVRGKKTSLFQKYRCIIPGDKAAGS